MIHALSDLYLYVELLRQSGSKDIQLLCSISLSEFLHPDHPECFKDSCRLADIRRRSDDLNFKQPQMFANLYESRELARVRIQLTLELND